LVRTEEQLLDEFHDLRDRERDSQARGRALEAIVARLFRRAHYHVQPDAGAAKPRQTDLIAKGHGRTLLIETKWTTKPSDAGDVDHLWARLGRVQNDVIGVLVSVAGFTSTVIDEIEAHRQRPVLLIDGTELEQLLAGEREVRAVLEDKHEALVIHGQVLEQSRQSARRVRGLASKPAAGNAHFVLPDGSVEPWLAAGGDFGQFTFARDVTDPDWVAAGGAGVTLDFAVPMDDASDVARVLTELADLGRATGAGHWCIQQSTLNWHGIGGESLIEATARWQERYASAERLHHREVVCYQDTLDHGFYTLTFDVSASEPRQVWHADMSMQLVGVPLDVGPITELCRTLGVRQDAHFRPRTEKVLTTRRLGHEPLAIEPVAFIVEEDPSESLQWVTGLVATNPWRSPRDLPDPLIAERASVLADSEMLICDLSSWHPLGEEHGPYRLHQCEWGWTSDVLVVRVSADWDH
jgi:hypothetical protein